MSRMPTGCSMCEDVGEVMGISDYPNIRGEIGGSSGLGQPDGDGDDDNTENQGRWRPLLSKHVQHTEQRDGLGNRKTYMLDHCTSTLQPNKALRVCECQH